STSRPTESRAAGSIPQLLLSGRFLGSCTPRDREGRASSRRAVPRVGFIVTTLTETNRAVVRFYNQRGTAEQWIKEGKTATHWPRLSCHRFRANEVRLLFGGHRVQPRESPASPRPPPGHPELVADESPAATLQDRRTPDPPCQVLHPAACRELLD